MLHDSEKADILSSAAELRSMSDEHLKNAESVQSEAPPVGGALVTVPVSQPPAHPPAPLPLPRRRRWLKLGFAAVLLLAAVGGGYWWLHRGPALPPGFAVGNGRLEADEIDIDTKFAGRIAKLLVDQGDMVKAGQVVAVMDTQDLQAQLSKSQALMMQSERALEEAEKTLAQLESQVLSSQAAVVQAQHALDEANATLLQQQAQVRLAKQELDRAKYLVPKGAATAEQLDQRQQVLDGANAGQDAAVARVGQAEQALAVAKYTVDATVASRDAAAARVGEAQHAIDAAGHDVEYYKVTIADNSLVAPRDGPIEYRVANVGEVLPAGGKVFTMLDASYVYMDIYLPTAEAGRVRIGAEARIVLDAYPDHVIPAGVVFAGKQAQFTPKTVETKDERDKLMFRIRVRIDPDRIKGREALVRSGLPGVAYVRTDASAVWPSRLQPSAPPSVPPAAPK
jgi:HlyD family secretion protein